MTELARLTLLVTTWEDSGPVWLAAIGGVLAVVVAAYALVRAIRAEATHVEWQVSNEPTADGKRSPKFRLINSTTGVDAHVTAVENVSDGLKDAVRNDIKLPEIVRPGSWVPLYVERSLGSPYPTIVKLTWREASSQGRPKRKVYASTFYLD